MKKFIFTESLGPLIEEHKPKIIVETGTNSGRSATWMCMQALQHHPDVVYHGFDLFDLATDETHAKEINGKGTGSYDKAHSRLAKLQKENPGFKFILHRGFTTDTFTSPIVADLVYIDGGHSTETVLHDYSMVKNSKVIVFDDFQMDTVKEAIRQIGIFDRVTEFPWKKTSQAIFINK